MDNIKPFKQAIKILVEEDITKAQIEELFKALIEHIKDVKSEISLALDSFKKSIESDISDIDSKIESIDEILNKKISKVEAKIPVMPDLTYLEKRIENVYKTLEKKIPSMPDMSSYDEEMEEMREELLKMKEIKELKNELYAMKELMKVSPKASNAYNFFGAVRTRYIDDETPTGTINGSNTDFTLAKVPVTGSLKVYRGGARQRVTEDYTFSGKTITFTIAPQVGEVLLVDYRY